MSEGIVKEKSKLQKAFEDAGRELGRGFLTLSACSVGFVGSLYSMIKLNPNITFDTEKANSALDAAIIGSSFGIHFTVAAVAAVATAAFLDKNTVGIRKYLIGGGAVVGMMFPIGFSALYALSYNHDRYLKALPSISANAPTGETVGDVACEKGRSYIALYTDKKGNEFQVACAPQ